MVGFAARSWFRGEDACSRALCPSAGKTHLRDSRQRNADRGKEPMCAGRMVSARPQTSKERTHDYVQRKTR